MFDNFDELEFLQDLNNSIAEEEKKELNICLDDTDDKKLINNQSQANYFCKLVNQLKEEANKKNEFINQEIDRMKKHYEEYREREINQIQRKIDFFENALKTYTLSELDGTNKKSIKLPHGTLSIKKQQPHYDYNEEEILKWLKEHNQNNFISIKTTESVNKKELKKQAYCNNGLLFIDNIPVSGVVVTPQDDKFEVK